MLDLVPLAGSRWKVGYVNRQMTDVSQGLQFPFPEADATAIAAATIGDDVQGCGVRIRLRSHLSPPAADRIHRESGGVMIHADRDPALVEGDVVHAVRDCPAHFWSGENVDPAVLAGLP